LGYILTLQGALKNGETLIRKALAGLQGSLVKDHPAVLTSLLHLSKNLVLQGGDEKLEEAKTLTRQALEARTKILGPRHPTTFKTVRQLARVLSKAGEWEEAMGHWEKATSGLQETIGADHPDVRKCEKDLAVMRAATKLAEDRALGGW
jgi:tetratricopeptide (TPR) repeat protein